MSKEPDKEPSGTDRAKVVDELLEELGVDNELKQELIDSGRLTTDVFMVESAEQVRRRMEIERSAERLRDSLVLLERNMSTAENTIDRIERDLVPVVLSFLVGLKGNLVNMRTEIVGRSKRRARTNMQHEYVESQVKHIVEDEFEKVEETLTTGMSAPIMEKVKDITEELKLAMKTTYEELTTLKTSADDFTQRATTEVEFLARELLMKPKVDTPQEVTKKLKDVERRAEELERDLKLAEEKLQNREQRIADIQDDLIEVKAREESLEETIASLKATPQVDTAVLAELRQNAKSLEAARDLLAQKADEAERSADRAESKTAEQKELVAKRDLEIGDLKTQVSHLEAEIEKNREQLLEVDELRARLRSYESGDMMRELDRVKSDLERATASFERLTNDHNLTKTRLTFTEQKLEGYLDLMDVTEKTKAFLMVEDNREMSVREIGRSLGVSPATVSKWIEDFQRLGLVNVKDDGQTVVLAREKLDL
ncbi:MAG: helix-turn-helix domain-containing protein [Candidatus Thorarchaeota archaeon]|jgi:DNA repair exonuclease SbcCD ATPase subunit